MEKITDKIAALPSGSSYFSLEFFPPKTDMGASNLRVRLDRMSRALRPLFVTVTWGAGGSTATKSLELAEVCQRELGLTTCLHLTCTNMSQALVDRALEDAKALGVRNILALRGDPPRNEEYEIVDPREPVAKKDTVQFEWAIDLVRYIRQQYGDYFCIGVAAYPEGHADESHPLGQSLEHDLPYLVEKVKAGADFIMTQLFFDIAAYDKFERTLREHSSGVFKNLPIIPGMMPIQSYQMIRRTTKLSHAALPTDIMTRLDEVKGDDEMVKKVGVDILCEIVDHLKGSPVSAPSSRGFHFYTLNLEKAVSHILERTSLIPPEEEFESAILDPVPSLLRPISPAKTSQGRPARRQSSIGSDPHNRIIINGPTSNNPDFEATANEAGIRAESVNTRANTLAISEGEGSLGREATWDDFPNGRWGDARSPAYGEIDGYGVSLHVSITSALRLWGLPTSVAEITQLFIQHIEGTIKAIPWSEEAFNEETNIIKPELLALNRKGWWTVASQPAVNGVRSSDPIFGWGPKNGYVFQKAFVELFLPSADWEILLKKLQRPGIAEYVSFYASNNRSYVSSDEEDGETEAAGQRPSNQPGRPSTNAVTWGAFPGKEIITPTIIERESFRAWCEEAYEIWAEWGRVYSVKGEKGLETKAVIDGVAKDVWLVNIIHHGYQEPNGLWDLLLNEQQNGH